MRDLSVGDPAPKWGVLDLQALTCLKMALPRCKLRGVVDHLHDMRIPDLGIEALRAEDQDRMTEQKD